MADRALALGDGRNVNQNAHERRVRVRVYGRVQGVNYRYAARQKARHLGVRGWVRNCSDGSVEAELLGTTEGTSLLLDWMRSGPPMAHVDRLLVEEPGTTPIGPSFEIR